MGNTSSSSSSSRPSVAWCFARAAGGTAAAAAAFHTALLQHHFLALMQHHFIQRFCSTVSCGACTAPFHMALIQHRFTWRLCSTFKLHELLLFQPYFLGRSTLPQKGGINGKVNLLNKMNTFTSSRPTLWLKSSRNCSGGWRGLVGGFSYYIKIFCQIYFIKIYIWKRGKPKSATHRRMLMPIWFHSLIILPGSAAGAAALKYMNCNIQCTYVYIVHIYIYIYIYIYIMHLYSCMHDCARMIMHVWLNTC